MSIALLILTLLVILFLGYFGPRRDIKQERLDQQRVYDMWSDLEP